ncbi:metallophosphoesterase family protein [Echinicola soli]|uniref:Metallophosphoesterase family protein n=1 Tax=Echinicola soli TaxID=2591634 RepID=A0A514CNE5_9BACT|nr:metallophosphoesterase family protein [Echinicola soli]QDH81310.1 metallophosphoesterase family protein [Echinicola soli]
MISMQPNLCHLLLSLVLLSVSCSKPKEVASLTAKALISEKVTELYATGTAETHNELTYEGAMDMFTVSEKKILATRHWSFEVNVPVTVSVMRSKKQRHLPFWLEENGFEKTSMEVSNEMTDYEVWQKQFDRGSVGLGINGLENYKYHYFVCVTPQFPNETLQISNIYPENQFIGTMDNGAFTYHDWDELVLFDVPEKLKGQQLLTTVRGRGTESHLVDAFRITKFPSSQKADQVMLTWSDDPATSVDIQWRTATSVQQGSVFYRPIGSPDSLKVPAQKSQMEDLRLANDRHTHRFTAKIRDLNPGTTYEYKLNTQAQWPEEQHFGTPSDDDSFSFIWYGDAHYSPDWGTIANQAFRSHPDAAFHAVAGDLVSDGLHRDQWDELFAYSERIISQKPFMNVLGNHDNRMGLGAHMYRDLFSYPDNGPSNIPQEHTYSFDYKNALFLMIDATSRDELQTEWIEQQLKSSNATWKFAMFHFPPYNWEEPYTNIQKEWIPLFDKYHVDMVFSGHIHYYMRSNPMYDGKVVDHHSQGTSYIISIGIPSGPKEIGEEDYAATRKSEGQFYQVIKIDGKTLTYSAIDAEENVIDEVTLSK